MPTMKDMVINIFKRKSATGVVAWNMASQIVGKVLGAGATFLATLLIARAYSAEGYGDFIKITTYVALFYSFADFGLNAIYLQQSQQPQVKNAWASLLGLRLLGSIFLIFAALSVLAFVPTGVTQGYTPLVRVGIIIFSPAIIFQTLLTSANAVFQKSLRYDFSTLAVGSGAAITLILLWLVTSWLGGASGVLLSVVSFLGGSAVTAVVALGLARRLTGTLRFSFRTPELLKIFVPAIPLGLAILFNLVYFHVDSVILALTRSTLEVGIYGLAYKVFEVSLVLPTFFMNTVYPLQLAASGKSEAERREFRKLFFRSLYFLSLASLFSLLVFWAAAPLLTLVRSDFALSIPALRVLALGLPLFFISALLFWTLIAVGRQTLLLVIYGIAMVVNILSNLVFIPRYGYMAAAWITVASEGLVLLMLIGFLHRILKPIFYAN